MRWIVLLAFEEAAVIYCSENF